MCSEASAPAGRGLTMGVASQNRGVDCGFLWKASKSYPKLSYPWLKIILKANASAILFTP